MTQRTNRREEIHLTEKDLVIGPNVGGAGNDCLCVYINVDEIEAEAGSQVTDVEENGDSLVYQMEDGSEVAVHAPPGWRFGESIREEWESIEMEHLCGETAWIELASQPEWRWYNKRSLRLG